MLPWTHTTESLEIGFAFTRMSREELWGVRKEAKTPKTPFTLEVDRSSSKPAIEVSALGLAVYTLLLGWSDLTECYVLLISACRSTVLPVM